MNENHLTDKSYIDLVLLRVRLLAQRRIFWLREHGYARQDGLLTFEQDCGNIIRCNPVENISNAVNSITWRCRHTWKKSASNTLWCLIGCSIGDFGTIAFFQFTQIPWPTMVIMILAIVNGLLTSIALETVILIRGGMPVGNAFHTAIGMSMVSMIAMEAAMNFTDWLLTGGALLTWWVVPIMLTVGFLVPWPYNYWRLKKWGMACH